MFSLCNLNAFAQNHSTLLFSYEVQEALFNHLNNTNLKCQDSELKYFARISYFGKDTIQINLCRYNPKNIKSPQTKLVESTTNRIKIKTLELPVLYDIDFLFSDYLNYNNKEGELIENFYSRGGFYVLFNIYEDNKIIRTGFEQ